jgi:type I restriction enzyme, S subunit
MEMVDKKTAVSKYLAYQDSGVEWLGEVPSKWTLTRLGSYFNERKTKVSDKDYLPLSVTKNGIVPQLESAAKSNDGDNRKLVRKGDFVINSRSDRKGSSGIAPMDGSVSLINIVIKPSFIFPAFCNYLLKSHAFVEENYRIGHGIVADLWTTRYDEMKNIKIALPSNQEQKTIAEFLDDKTSKIDRAIAQKERMIELLKERKQIIIQNAVTKGLDPNVKMKDSGVDWIGEIPEHWEVKRLKFLLSEFNVRSTSGGEELLSLSKYKGVIPKTSLEERAGGAESLIGYKIVNPRQLVINKMQAVNGLLAVSKIHGITSPDYSIYYSKNDFVLDIYYLENLLLQVNYLAEFKRRVTGVMEGFIRLYTDDLFGISVNLPPLDEQKSIVNHIVAMSTKIENTIALEQSQIEKLKEYKATLIDSAVTGKIKVC